jgi:hypothetical protein
MLTNYVIPICFRGFQSEHFPFLGIQSGRPYSDMRCRTTFYIALGRLLIVDLGEDDEKFEQFMAPETSKYKLDSLQNMIMTIRISIIIILK